MGVWIEIIIFFVIGLCHLVTPFMGVWIEIKILSKTFHYPWSHPLWVCGLKFIPGKNRESFVPSHPLWVCGLKSVLCDPLTAAMGHTLYGCVDWNSFWEIQIAVMSCVTPFMGVWIEICQHQCNMLSLDRHTLYGCVDWNCSEHRKSGFYRSHTLYGCVDWNTTKC